jgi:DDE superfamily endonuclease/Tc5 transposase DNA-binding domain
MAPIDEAIEEIKSHGLGGEFSYRKVAERYGVSRETLRRLHQEISVPREQYKSEQRKITQEQERELVSYIEQLTARRLQPTREMVQNFASAIAKQPMSKSWVSRFLNSNQTAITPHWAPAMDKVRHHADSEDKYRQFFQLVAEKMEEYNIKQRNTYNMDEKGFLLGVLGRSKRIFSKAKWDSREVRTALQDGNREWITLLACICADGSALPPAILFAAANKAIQSAWVEDIEAIQHQVFISSSPNGWTNNDIGLAWLEQVFNRYTKVKAKRSWRLLILDGHGSHITMDFINFCHQNRILLLVFPPHSTHTLQPLDVVMFKPLSTAYSKALTQYLHNAQGLVSVKKGDFFLLFWQAWTESFQEQTILKSFEATGLWPLNPEAILKRFQYSTPEQDSRESSTSVLSGKDWQKIQTLVKSVAKEQSSKETQKLQRSLHHISVQNDLLHTEIQGLRQALLLTQKHKKKSKPLDLQQRQEYHGGAVLWSPRKIREAQARERVREQEEEEQQLERARVKAEKAQQKALKLQQQEERQRLKVEKREERERIKAAQKAARERKKQEKQNTQKSIQTSQKGKRKASNPPAKKQKKQRRTGSSVEGAEMGEDARAISPLPTTTTRSGRNIKLPRKFK